jgi:predicted MPP superfamily phosphohydrolase
MQLGPGTRWASVRSALPWRYLENESIEIDGVVFAGLRPFSVPDEAAALKFLSGLEKSKPTVLINHKPRLVEEAAAAGVNLQLSGHTHGGPVFPVNIIMRHILKGRHHGTSTVDGMVLDVSSGSGISLWYPRTAGRHELVVVEFSGADSRR